MIEGVRHEDLTNLSFESESLDLVICLEVMEHIPDFKKAYKEIFRVLAPGGIVIFSAPFTANKEENTIRATMKSDGTINHIMEPEYHGDPVNKKGILCFQYFGWECLSFLRSLGFIEVNLVSMWSVEFGLLGLEQIQWYAKK